MHASFLKVKSVPEVIETKPDQSKNETHRVLTLGRSIHLHGLFQSEEILTDWRLPIGSELESNSVLTLHLQHSPELATPYSKLDVYLERQLLGSLPLSPATAKGGSYRFAVPPGIVQQDPLVFTLRSSLDLTETDCATRHEENAWLTILPDSALDAHLRPAPAAGDDADLQSRLALDASGLLDMQIVDSTDGNSPVVR